MRKEKKDQKSHVKCLRCRECKREYPLGPINICEVCFGPLEVEYDYDSIELDAKKIKSRKPNMWRYAELLPVDGDPVVQDVGFTPIFRARNLEKYFGCKEIWIKNDGVNFPTLSFKDRVVSIAVKKAKDFGFNAVACASTGNLANSVASISAMYGMKAFIFIPYDLEPTKILATSVYGAEVIGIKGNYDNVNRLCTEISERYKIAFVNINIRPFYSEGSKTYGFEIAEQLSFRLPDHVVVPIAGGSLIVKIWKAFKEFERLGLLKEVETRMYGAQPEGCAPVVNAVKKDLSIFTPVKEPKTIAKSLAIGNPPDGYYSIKVIRESKGYAESPSDKEIIEAIKILAEKEGIYTETAGGVTFGAFIRLLHSGKISKSDSSLICLTGNGLKTQEALAESVPPIKIIEPTIENFQKLYDDRLQDYKN
ncbi:MAG: threonine synthase [Candidatus Calescibacterium sp.]|nr:threonine synthase [Candidatus Calescibacterium sp.]MCX7734940.1 threonine synthase [bacterium]MDW8087995.1 threonine synthase [Candidatus Calescibacterium sp.]